MFLRDRDRARLRGDSGIDRAITADLRRLGVSDTATLADPSGKHSNGQPQDNKRKSGRPPKPRCEHGQIADRCAQCEEAEIEEARVTA